ncbi:hypothetical protein D3C74_264260 [compost metagenome]
MGKTTVEVQVEKIFKHTRQGSYATRDRYKDSCLMFVRFCASSFKMQNVRNLSDKHIVAFVQSRQRAGSSARMILLRCGTCMIRFSSRGTCCPIIRSCRSSTV